MQDLNLSRGSVPTFKGSTSPFHPCPVLRATFPPPCRGEIQIYRWGHFTGQLRQETGNKKGRLFAASRTSVVRAFWKALYSCRSWGRQERWQRLGCHRKVANHSCIPTFPFVSKEGFGATVSCSAALHGNTKLCTLVETPPPQVTGVPSSWSGSPPRN